MGQPNNFISLWKSFTKDSYGTESEIRHESVQFPNLAGLLSGRPNGPAILMERHS